MTYSQAMKLKLAWKEIPQPSLSYCPVPSQTDRVH